MPSDMTLLLEKLKNMKEIYEGAIREGKYLELIRSQKLINILHDYAKKELARLFPSTWIYKEKKIYGYPKTKSQDILIQPPQNGSANISTGPIAIVNIRSQLSSIEKNYDTLFERLFAEALNIHNRFPHVVLAYIYLLPKIGYDEEAAKRKEVARTERYDLEKYIISFLSITNRKDPEDSPWKYERMALLIVDFEKDPPIVLDDMNSFLREKLVSEDFARSFTFEPLSIRNFFDDIYKIAMQRYYLLLGRRKI